MASAPDYDRLEAAFSLIPELAERADYDLRGAFDLALKNGLWSCSLSDSSPLAFGAGYEHDGAFRLWLIGVRPDHRRLGLASALFHCYLSEGARRGFTTFTARVHADNAAMVCLLESAGFSQTSLGLEVIEVGGISLARELLAFTLQK